MNRPGFTLIELLVVLALLALLSGLAMPLVGIAQRNAKRSAVHCTAMKIEVACRQFADDAGHPPWSANPAAPAGPWDNELGYRLAHALTATELDDLKTDLAAATAAYAPGGGHHIAYPQFDQPPPAGATPRAHDYQRMAMAVNLLGAERARIGIMSGNISIAATAANGGARWQAAGAVLANPASRGWCGDYLGQDLKARDLARDAADLPTAILDPWRTPYVHVSPSVNGVSGYAVQGINLQAGTTGVGWIVSADWFGFRPTARLATTSRASDIRTHAGTAFVSASELWSAGPDLSFHAQRDDALNADNLSYTPYLRNLR